MNTWGRTSNYFRASREYSKKGKGKISTTSAIKNLLLRFVILASGSDTKLDKFYKNPTWKINRLFWCLRLRLELHLYILSTTDLCMFTVIRRRVKQYHASHF